MSRLPTPLASSRLLRLRQHHLLSRLSSSVQSRTVSSTTSGSMWNKTSPLYSSLQHQSQRPLSTTTSTTSSSSSSTTKALEAELNFTEEINVTIHTNGCCEITLNRPKALNALSHVQVRALGKILPLCEESPSVQFYLIRGAGEKAFCAGGDVRSIVEASSKGGSSASQFFGDEYYTDYLTSTLTKSYIALWDGIVMGGGVGVSLHGSHRIATEKTMLAMPETTIGFFPDVGVARHLSRLGGAGLYMGLTGARIGGRQAKEWNFATHLISSEKLQNLITQLRERTFPSAEKATEGINAALKDLERESAESVPKPPISPEDFASIAECFAPPLSSRSASPLNNASNAGGMETHGTRLSTFLGEVQRRAENLTNTPKARDEVVKSVAEIREKKCPLSCVITFIYLTKQLPFTSWANPASASLSELSLKEVLGYDYKIAQMLAQYDSDNFREGVRALLIEKTQDAKWSPASIEEVEEDTERLKKIFECPGRETLQGKFKL